MNYACLIAAAFNVSVILSISVATPYLLDTLRVQILEMSSWFSSELEFTADSLVASLRQGALLGNSYNFSK